MQGAPGLTQTLEQRQEGMVSSELTLLDGVGDACEILVHDAPSAEVHVPYLGIAHLSRRKTNVSAGTGDQRVRPLAP